MNALVLLSGGLDSAVMLAQALKNGRKCRTLSFDYGQRHRLELRAAKNLAKAFQVPHQVIKIDTATFGENPLISGLSVPKDPDLSSKEIATTYLPARNTLFLAFALGQAELNDIHEIYFGSNKDDYNAYPDCRKEFFDAFQKIANLTTCRSKEVAAPKIVAPFVSLTKTEIVKLGIKLKVPLSSTLSCYDPTPLGEHCKKCLACSIRNRAFEEAHV